MFAPAAIIWISNSKHAITYCISVFELYFQLEMYHFVHKLYGDLFFALVLYIIQICRHFFYFHFISYAMKMVFKCNINVSFFLPGENMKLFLIILFISRRSEAKKNPCLFSPILIIVLPTYRFLIFQGTMF